MDHAQSAGQRFAEHAGEPLVGLSSVRRATADPAVSVAVDADTLPVSGVLDDGDSPGDVVDLLLLEPFSTGRQPFARTRELEDVLPAAPLLPARARLIRDAEDDHKHHRLAVGEGWTVRSVRWKRSRRASVTVTATTAELADEQLGLAIEGAVDPAEQDDDRVPIGFWYQTSCGPRRIPRDIETATWPKIRGNYSERVSAALEPLMSLTGDGVNGRLLLLHGPPGTGKTTLLRTLARQWRDWCRVDCVLDPERLFSEPAYLLDVALGDDDDDGGHLCAAGHSARTWRLLLLEDCDELIRGEAKSATGQQLSRLLNLTDGLLGQGRNVMVAITTNEDVTALHPAVIRPGRSLAHLEVGRLNPAEAGAWLATHAAQMAQAAGQVGHAAQGVAPSGQAVAPHPAPTAAVGPAGATLAELFAVASGTVPPSAAEPAPGTGLYL